MAFKANLSFLPLLLLNFIPFLQLSKAGVTSLSAGTASVIMVYIANLELTSTRYCIVQHFYCFLYCAHSVVVTDAFRLTVCWEVGVKMACYYKVVY